MFGYGIGAAYIYLIPDLPEYLLVCKHPARILGKEPEHIIFLAGKIHGRTFEKGRPPLRVHDQAAAGHNGIGRFIDVVQLCVAPDQRLCAQSIEMGCG